MARWSYRQTLWITLLPLLITNGTQWATARQKSATRDEQLLRAFSASVEALDDAREVLAHAEARIRKCEARGGAKSQPKSAPMVEGPAIMLREDTLDDRVVDASPSSLGRVGNFAGRVIAWATTPPLATAILNDVARQHEVKQ